MMLEWWRRRGEKVDRESDKLWDSFRKAQACWACKNIEEFHRKHGLAVLFMHDKTEELKLVTIRYCPSCGRQLIFAQ